MSTRLQSLGLRKYQLEITAAGFKYRCLPIVDMCAPDDARDACAFIRELAAQIQDGERVLVHCRCGTGRKHHDLATLAEHPEVVVACHSIDAQSMCRQCYAEFRNRLSYSDYAVTCSAGHGRAGMIASCLLMCLGVAASAADAIALVRKAQRSDEAVRTTRQQEFVHWFGTAQVETEATLCRVQGLSAPSAQTILTAQGSKFVRRSKPQWRG